MLPPPGFHHLHLNSLDPTAAIDFYTRQFARTSKATWGGFPALKSPTDVLILFSRVDAPPPVTPQSAIWHFGWHVTDVRQSLETYKARPDVELLPLYTIDEGSFVHISSDTWPGTGGVLGLTKTQIAEAKAKGVKPAGGGGFAYMHGPDGAIVEYLGNQPVVRMSHVHMQQEHKMVRPPNGFVPKANTPDEFVTANKVESERWAKVIRAAISSLNHKGLLHPCQRRFSCDVGLTIR